MSWYEEWFNSDEYLQVYKHRDESEAQVLLDLILSNVERDKIRNVLDMACGAGRHSIAFAKKGFSVTAVDLSERLLNEAKKNAAESGTKISFVLSDIRNFESTDKFQLAVNLFTSIGYFETDAENFSVIEKGYNNLTDPGYFVLDYFNKNYLELNLVPITVEKINGKTITQKRYLENSRVIKNVKVAQNGSTKNFYESVRLYSLNELKNGLESMGFKILRIFGDYYGKPFDIDSSPRVIFIAQK